MTRFAAMRPKFIVACFLGGGFILPACSSDPAAEGDGDSTVTDGSGGVGGSGGTGLQTGGTGLSSGSGGLSSGGSSSGGTGGATGGTMGSGGTGGEPGFWGPGGPQKQWTCPDGPFPAQEEGQSTDVCVGLDYNHEYNEGPTWIASQSAFFFTNFIQGSNLGGDIIKVTLDGECEIWLEGVGCNGLGVSPSGNLLAACHGPRAVMEYDVVTKEDRTIATAVDGDLLDSPNDLIARSDGNVYFSNTTYELGDRPAGLGFGLVRIDPMGNTSLIEGGNLNGIALSPDESELHVVGKGTWTLDANGEPSSKGQPTPSGDGIAVDCAGNISNRGTNSAFGGPDGKTLLVVGGGTNASFRAMTVPGLP